MVLTHTFLIFSSLSEHGPGGIDGLASWPQLCAPLMVAFGPTDDQQVPPVTCCQWPPALTCHQSHFMSVWRAQWVHTVNQWLGKEYWLQLKYWFSRAVLLWVLTLRFMGFPGDRGDNPPLRSRPNRAQCLCEALNSQFLSRPRC